MLECPITKKWLVSLCIHLVRSYPLLGLRMSPARITYSSAFILPPHPAVFGSFGLSGLT